ncbi:(2Fe-2S)-binding protein [Caballeronia mineralivorans]|uniref:(2Fe-2S)-binding protein n=1 Tax=Caballeronia mineralivorans TaxID=2010198 RepID=UPI0009E4D8B8|nr:(2Fe-2S)-binding protein [Caballeronia mineralivorans]
MFRKLHDPGATVPALTLTIDGQTVSAEPGDSIAAVLLRLDPPFSRTTPVSGSPRTPYCMMGVCFECLASVDGVASTQTCLVQVREGMRVERQHGRRALTMAMSENAAVDDVSDVGTADPRDGMPSGVSP